MLNIIRGRRIRMKSLVITIPAVVAAVLINIMLFYPFTTIDVRYVYSFEINGIRPGNVAYDAKNDRIIVADEDDRILIYDKDGRLIKEFGQKGEDPGKFNGIMDLTYDPDNDRIIVADGNNRRIQVFDKDGNFLFMFKPSIGDIIVIPSAVTYDIDDGRIIVGNAFISTLLIHDKTGNLLTRFDIPIPICYIPGLRLISIHDIAYDPDNDRIIVADKDGCTNNVHIFKDGRLLFTLLPPPSTPYLDESRVAYDPNNDRIIVGVVKRAEIFIYDSDGNFITSIGHSNDIHISDITYDPNNDRIIVAERNHDYGRVLILTLVR